MRLKGVENEHLIPSWIINKLTKTMDADIRVVVTWDTDLTDVSLHVFEPENYNGEHCCDFKK